MNASGPLSLNVPVATEGTPGAMMAPTGEPSVGYASPRTTTVMCISSDSLLAGASEVHIEHRGSVYRLKQTSLGKLILTK